MRSTAGWRRDSGVTALITLVVLLAGCSFTTPTGNAPSQAPEFTSTAPGGETRIFYDPPASRGEMTELSGQSLLEPGRSGVQDVPTTSLQPAVTRARSAGVSIRDCGRTGPGRWPSPGKPVVAAGPGLAVAG